MSLQTLLEDSTITIAYDHLNEWLYADWHGDQSYPRKKKAAPQGARDDADRSGR